MSFLPLSALLSHALVAFTIEFDNEAEHRMPHWTTNYGASAGWTAELQRDMAWGPWLTSMVMWTNCMQFVGEDGITVRELERLARTHTNLNGMERWGYVVVEPDPEDKRAKPPRSAWVIRAKPSGRKAREIWQPLFGVIETRWRERFGKQRIEALRESLCAVIGNMDLNLPDCLPILGYGLYSNVEQKKWERHDGQEIESGFRVVVAGPVVESAARICRRIRARISTRAGDQR
jgi:hypothetical protein